MNPITERRLAAIHRHLCSGQNFAPAASPLGLQDVCGIIAYIGQEPAAKFLHEGLSILQNRGYDSAGISTVNPKGELVTTKFASVGSTSDAIDKLAETLHHHESNTIGIAHTRWATHGAKTDKNAHPHHDQSDRIALVHNGVIENSNDLREELQKKGIKFRSETDTEVIVQLIGYHLQESNDLVGAVKQALSRLEGTWGIVVLDRKNPNELLAAKNGSPLLVGQGQGKMFVASEASAFSRHTKEYISLENGEVIVIRVDGHSLDQSRVELAPTEKIRLNPDPFPHWTLKEILEQPEAISRSLNYGGRLIDESTVKLGGLEEQRESLKGIKNLIISACGTSLHAAHFGAGLMRSLQCFETVQVVDAAELGREYFTQGKCGMLVLSQSGETKDVHRALTIAEELNIPVFSVVNVVGSLIARTTRCGVYLNAGREMAVASTKAFTCQVAVFGTDYRLVLPDPRRSSSTRGSKKKKHDRRPSSLVNQSRHDNPQIEKAMHEHRSQVGELSSRFHLGQGPLSIHCHGGCLEDQRNLLHAR
eukprot:TRINITY_DN1440_c0_g2_i1.p1 TRINITY_DN1440_c0_g2~~TRINITY_DN1440_c0_g2_i1.p1  ORF type:complete len:566 (+),score=163.96 TRINITY_DN1440_c0_g2_i1:95-1699(+)